jgi:hypothetical protein
LPVTVITKTRQSSASPQGTLVAGVPVYSVQPSGSAGPTGQTDSNGKVVLDGVQAGATITAVYTIDATDYQLVTVVGVKPGDTITLGDMYALASPTGNTGVLNVTFPTVTGATNYQVFSPCNNTNGGASPIALPENCTQATANLALIAQDDGGNTLAGGALKNVPYTDGQTGALSAWKLVPSGGFSVSISGVISDVTQAGFWADMVVDGAYTFDRGQSVALTSGAGTGGFQIPPAGDRTSVGATLPRTGYGAQETYLDVAPTATSAALPAPTLPWLSQRVLDQSAQQVAWLQTGGTGYDGALATMSYFRTDATSGTTTNYSWAVLVPSGQTSFQWAAPITALAPYVPATTDSFNSFYIQLVDLSSAADYDGLRAAPEWQWRSPYNATEDGELTGVSSVAYGAEGNTSTGSAPVTRTR